MLFRTVPKTGDSLSILGFGCMRLPQKGRAIDEERATKQIRSAIDAGVNYVDTAMPYHAGNSETFLGKALSDGYREKVFLATKLPPWQVKARADMDRLLDSQLVRLCTDHIDYYLIHSLTGESWDKMLARGVLDFLTKAKEDGRIRRAGFSFHGNGKDFTRIVDAYDWDFCQIQYNFLDTENQAGTKGLKYAAQKKLGVIIMEPLRGGNLTKRIPSEVQALWDQAPSKRSAAEWALRWVWNHPEVTTVLSGMNEEEHVTENLRIASEGQPDSLSKEELETVDRVAETYQRLMKVNCTGCRYCMPCPHGVDIPSCFEAFNNLHMFQEGKGAKMFYLFRVGGLTGKPAYASLCKDCGVCVSKCPQGIPIPSVIKEVSKEFDGPKLTIMKWVAKGFLGFQRLVSFRTAKKRRK